MSQLPLDIAAANAADALLGAPKGLRWLSGDQFGSQYHGTSSNWAEPGEGLHMDSNKHDFPVERAFPLGWGAYDDWMAMDSGVVKEFRFRPDARVHITDTPHHDGALPDSEMKKVSAAKMDATMFPGRKGMTEGLSRLHNPASVEHVADHSYKDVQGDPVDHMEMMYGDNWWDEVQDGWRRN